MGTEVKSTVAANNSNGSAQSTPAICGENIQDQPTYYWDHLYGGLSKKFCDFVCRIRKFAYLCIGKNTKIVNRYGAFIYSEALYGCIGNDSVFLPEKKGASLLLYTYSN